MPSPFQSALFALIAAEREYDEAHRKVAAWNPSAPPSLQEEIDRRAQALTQAGDVLEREIRQMMREEAPSSYLRGHLLPHGGYYGEP